MSLQSLLAARLEAGKPVRVGLIGAGKFGSMFLAQAPSIAGLEVAVIADLDPERAKLACKTVGWDAARIARTRFADDGRDAIADERVDVVIEATGSPNAGIAHALAAFEAKKHIVMVNVEADALAGPLSVRKAREAGVIYSMAYGDQPALIAEMVDWARSAGFVVAAAGKGTKYLPAYHAVTPDGVWEHYGLTADEAKAAGMNSQMFNSFLDGTKSAIEMSAVANACDLDVPHDGLKFPPCGADELAQRAAAESDRRRARARRHGRGGVVAAARRRAGRARSALGRLCRAQGAATITPRPASSNTVCRPMRPAVMRRCTSRST